MLLDQLILLDVTDNITSFNLINQITYSVILELLESEYFMSLAFILHDSCEYFIKFLNTLTYFNLILSVDFDNVQIYIKSFFLVFTTFSSNVTSYTIKFILMISILIFARGGIPRYRYDYLTKLGWIRCLSWIGFWFLLTVLSIFFF